MLVDRVRRFATAFDTSQQPVDVIAALHQLYDDVAGRVIHRFGETHQFCARLALISLTISSAQRIGVFDVVSTVMSYRTPLWTR